MNSASSILTLETGTHRAAIHAIATDEKERFIVTASDDKTIRVWNPQGKLLRVIRPPFARGQEGVIHTVAISPDARFIAAAGWTGHAWEKQMSVYIFERDTGELVRRIKALPNVVDQLAYSPDGRFLVVGMARRNGLRVYAPDTLRQISVDTEYNESVSSIDFDAQGRMVTASLDGHIRLYGRAMEMLARVRAPGGDRPSSVAFSPDGRMVAVGYQGARTVSVLDGEKLQLLFTPDCKDVVNGDLARVAFSSDGKVLYAAGALDRGGPNPIRAWAKSGRGEPTELAASEGVITALVPMKKGIVFGSTDAAWGVVNQKGKRTVIRAPAMADFRNIRENLHISPDGRTVRFWFTGSSGYAAFSLRERTVVTGAAVPRMQRPITDVPGIEVRGWQDSTTPSVKGVLLKLGANEVSRSLAIAPDHNSFVLGAEWSLNKYDRQGRRLWTTPVSGAAYGVNITADGRLIVATLGDGTIRWFRTIDGKEVLSFFPHPDQKNWVLWTPSGYFDASREAASMMGWQESTGPDRASSFTPADEKGSALRNPELVTRMLETLDEDVALDAMKGEPISAAQVP